LGILTVNALVASTHLMVPIQAAYFAIEGTDDLLETYERIRARPNPGLKVLGVVITLFDKRTNISRDTTGRFAPCLAKCCSRPKSARTCGWKRIGKNWPQPEARRQQRTDRQHPNLWPGGRWPDGIPVVAAEMSPPL